MARGARIVNEFQRYQDVSEMFISYNGQIKEIGEAFVSYGGVIKQWWPQYMLENSSLAYDGVDRISSSFGEPAIFELDSNTGFATITNTPPDASNTYRVTFEAINPPPRATGQYLFKLEQLSGTPLTANFTLGAWVDMFSQGNLYIWEANLETAGSAQARFSVAKDDGTGNPEGTPIEGLIDYLYSEAVGNIIMTTKPWNLHNTEVNELAEVFVVFAPEGWYDPVNDYNLTETFVNGEFGFPKGIQESEIALVQWYPNVLVRLDVVSGGPVQGATTGANLTTWDRIDWYIEANPGEDVAAEVDLTIIDGGSSVTKRINMRATSTVEAATSALSDEFTRADRHFNWQLTPNPPFNEGTIDFFVNPDGTLTTFHDQGGEPGSYPQDWNTAAPAVPDPENFECRITWLRGWRYLYYFKDDGTTELVAVAGADRRDSSPWQNLSEQRKYKYFFRDRTGRTDYRWTLNCECQIEIREVGRPETVKIKPLELQILIQT